MNDDGRMMDEPRGDNPLNYASDRQDNPSLQRDRDLGGSSSPGPGDIDYANDIRGIDPIGSGKMAVKGEIEDNDVTMPDVISVGGTLTGAGAGTGRNDQADSGNLSRNAAVNDNPGSPDELMPGGQANPTTQSNNHARSTSSTDIPAATVTQKQLDDNPNR